MSWNPSIVDGPIVIAIYGDPDPVTGERPVTGVEPGYHLNLARSALPAGAAAFEVAPDPATPARVFAGDELGEDGRFRLTAFLRFADEAEAIATLPGFWTAPPEEGGEE